MKTKITIEFGEHHTNPNPRSRWFWIGRCCGDTLCSRTEYRHLFWGRRVLLSWSWTRGCTVTDSIPYREIGVGIF